MPNKRTEGKEKREQLPTVTLVCILLAKIQTCGLTKGGWTINLAKDQHLLLRAKVRMDIERQATISSIDKYKNHAEDNPLIRAIIVCDEDS